MRLTNRKFMLFLLVIWLLVAVGSAAAQGDTGTLPPFDFNQWVQKLIEFVMASLTAFLSAPATNAIVAFLKRYVFKDASASLMALIVAAVLAVLLSVAAFAGVEGQFRTVVDLLTVILSSIVGIGLNLNGEARVYASNAKNRALMSVGAYTRD